MSRWAQDPACTEDRSRDPLESLHLLFSRLDEIGRGDIVRVALAYLATALDDDALAPPECCKSTLEQEVLGDYQAVTALQHAIAAQVPAERIDALTQAAKEEIDRTRAKYHLEHGQP